MMRMTIVVILVLVILPAGCQRTETTSPETTAGTASSERGASTPAQEIGDAVATWEGGRADAAEVERRLSEVPARRRAPADADADARVDAVVDRYRRAARALAVEAVLLARVANREAAVAELELTESLAALRRQSVVQAYLQDRVDAIEIDDGAIEAYYEAHSEQFEVAATVLLWNIYRRHEDPAAPEATHALLRSLRERFLAGETFAALAREYSHSETRLRDGQVGRFAADALPPALAEVAFAIEEGGVSEPLPVQGGAVLLHVSTKTDGNVRTLGEVKRRIDRLLRNRALEEEVAARVQGVEPPKGATIYDVEELEEILDGEDPDRVVLTVGDYRVLAGDFRRFMSRTPPPADLDPKDDSDEALRARRAYAYRLALQRGLLYGELVRTGEGTLAADLRAEVDEQLAAHRDRLITDAKLRARMEALAEGDEERLRRFYEDQQHHFQSALRFQVRALVVNLANDPIAQMTALEEVRAQLVAGELTVEAAAAEVGGEVVDHGWLEAEDLAPIARTHVLELGGTGFAVPYAYEEKELHLLQVRGREEPRPLTFDEVRERVAKEYVRWHSRALSDQATEEILAAAGFRFHEENIRQYLAPPS